VSRKVALVDLEAQRRRLDGAIEAAIARVVEHGAFVMGPEVAQLEDALARRAGVDHAVTCGSGTDALLLPLLALGVGRGDAVLVPTFTFAATAEVVSLLGATPVFVDVRPDTFDLDPARLEEALAWAGSTELHPRAVIPVDLFGLPADYDEITDIAAAAGCVVIADAAQSFGGSDHGAPVGSLAALTSTSFFPAKPLGCYGDGGAVFTGDAAVADVMRSLRVHGQGSHKYDTVRIGLNARMDTIQAAILLAKLDVYDEELAARRRIAARYDDALRGLVEVPGRRDGAESAWAQYTIRVADRDAVAGALGEAGVGVAVYYPKALHQQPAYTAAPVPGGAPTAERLAEEVLSLPVHPYLSDHEVGHVIEAVQQAVRR